MGLTQRQIKAARYKGDGSSRDVRYDEDLPGFGVRIYPTGRKAFILRYRTQTGRDRMITLGRFGVLTLDQARRQARKRLGEIAAGEDPLAERGRPSTRTTLKDFGEKWLEVHAKPHRRSWREDERRLDAHIYPRLGHLALEDIRRSDVAELHADIGRQTPIEANRTVELLRAVLNKAQAWGYLPEDAANPARLGSDRLQKFREQSRDRWLRPEEVQRLAKAVNESPDPYVRAAVWLWLLLGVRKSELLAAKWKDLDLDRRVLRLSNFKSGRPVDVPLPAIALDLLDSLPRHLHNPHIFPGRAPGTHRQDIRKTWNRIRAEAKLPAKGDDRVTVHTLRHTVGSWLVQNGASLELIGEVLDHSDPAATRVYAHLRDDQKRQALEQHAERIVAAANAKEEK